MIRYVASADGTRIAVREHGDPRATAIVCVHGFPDTASIWEGVAGLLADRYRVVAYDVRGAGHSDRPRATAAYRLDRLAEDLRAVIDSVGPPGDVHLLGHDWGSIQIWHALARGLPAASFTSISGPDLDRARALLDAKQVAKSGYILFFQVPGAAELMSRLGLLARVIKARDASRRGHPIEHDDVRHGLKLYRANMFRRRAGTAAQPVTTRVQVIAPTRDPFVGAAIQVVEDAPMKTVSEGHWLPLANPRFVADCVEEFIA